MSLRPVPHLRIPALAIFGSALALVLTGCQQLADHSAPQTTVIPSSDVAGMIVNLYVLIFIMAAVVFIGVEGFLIFAIIKFRRRHDELPAQVHGNTRLEIAWTLIPALVLLIIAVPTIGTIFASDTIPPTVGQRIQVVAHQWWWEYRYTDLNIVTANEIHLPVNETVVFELATADVIHSFWFPRMGAKMDVVPNRKNHMWFTPKETGEFYGQCVEFCGFQHANMRMRLFVDTPEDFNRWVRQQQAPAPEPVGATAQRGAQAFKTSGCIACHTIRGTDARGLLGPDLTHVGSRKTIAAGVLDNTAANMSAWIKDSQSIKPGNKMVVAAPSPSDLTDIVAYLQGLR